MEGEREVEGEHANTVVVKNVVAVVFVVCGLVE